MNKDLEIINYSPEYKAHFESLNKAWLEKHFCVEPIDKYVLENPEEAILEHGGVILFAKYQGNVIGTVALKLIEPGVYEMTKMAVDESFRGIGAGKALCAAAIEKAKFIHADRLILYSTTVLEPAISIYYKLGFQEIPLEPGVYQRANIKMEYPLSA
ncbi:MAG: family N-acetyltransferase [Pedobacter sp.]|jgi:ribosomal protein S18 acetylase RimI-like enzyme|nr:family N-acetyltransferase [Pedobacter sp.]